ncbi:hypothetical protein [Nonomuraea aridisoli]|uniref:Uncharacterized protein n=1 Tax=Nonomuraea aridisoli TaxID=2070368 RepID=A0A2W2E3P3_9ACTN|nr:hypothetical protein [Nonomuraea aridisoli]PZG04247.1 hypothetical protein C1J01_44875 [Nonomuraea aridisoli]
MERFAREVVERGDQADPVCGWAGLYHVCGVHADVEKGDVSYVRLDINDRPLASTRCFAWGVEGGHPSYAEYEDWVRPLSGRWSGCRGRDGW